MREEMDIQDSFLAACREGDIEKVKLFLGKGANIEAGNNYGEVPPLIWASIYSKIEVVKFLLEKGADIEAKSDTGYTLYSYLNEEDKKIIDFYLKDIEERKRMIKPCSFLATCNVAKKREPSTAPSSLSMREEMDIQRSFFENCEEGDIERVKELIEKGADIEARNNNGCTPLILASYHGHVEVVKFLLEKGANLETRDNEGSTPLILASLYIEIVNFFIEKGADVESKDNEGNTPLVEASLYGNIEVVKFLIEKGADVEVKNRHRDTPLVKASRYGHIEVAKFLVEKGADIEARNNLENTPLIVASRNGKLEVVKFLIEQGADVEAKNRNGDTYYDCLNEENKKIIDFYLKDIEERKRMVKPCKK